MKTKKERESALAIAQRIGSSLFIVIAILPVAGVLYGIGCSFTNETTIATYGLSGILHQGTIPYAVLSLLNSAGAALFGNLPLLFAMAVGFGMSKKEKGVAALSAATFYLIMHTTINMLLTLDGSIVDGVVAKTVKDGAIASVLGIQTLQMGVFGGIIAGLITAYLCNRFYKIELPTALGFFGGSRFVPIISIVGAIITGFVMYLVWPVIQNGIFALGSLVMTSGYFGTFLFGCIERALIPFGLHHIFYLPFWQTGMGGQAVIDGVTYFGAQNIFFAELGSNTIQHFSVSATRFLAGKYPFMMGGLPGAALAMYMTAKPEKRKVAGSLLFSAALTSFLTGITEPIEFTFLFLAPALFVIHVGLAGAAFVTCHVLNICIGTTFSDGLIDFVLYGVLPGQSRSNWMMMIPVILVYFVIYFVIFRFAILKWDLKTPGREDDDEEAKLYSKADYQNATGVGIAGGAVPADFDTKSATILEGVGGVDNLTSINCCATRLRLSLVDVNKKNDAILKATGATGIVVQGNGIQIIYGPAVTNIKNNFEEFVALVKAGKIPKELLGTFEEEKEERVEKTVKDQKFASPINGEIKMISEVEDEGIASYALGDGVAIEPADGKVYAPADATVSALFDTKHAICLTTKEGAQMILHIGIDTVKLNGKYFETHVEKDQEVKKGDLLISYDLEAVKKEGYACTTPMLIVNQEDYQAIRPLKTGNVKVGEDILSVNA